MSVIGINIKQNKKLTLLFAIFGVVSTVLGGFLIYQKLKQDKAQRELNEIDRELKQLQLAEIKRKNANP